MEFKSFIQQFVTTADLAESDLEEIWRASGRTPRAWRRAIEQAFKIGVAEGFSSAECTLAQALNVKVDELEELNNPALKAVREMSLQCYRAANEEDEGASYRAARTRS